MKIDRRQFGALFVSQVALMGGSALMPQHARAAQTLVFGVISPRAAEQTRGNWMPFVSRLGAAVGMAIDLRVYAEQKEIVKAFSNDEVDIGWMGNAPALDVVESGKGAVFAQMVMKEGSFGYKSVLIVPASSSIKSLSDVLKDAKGLRFSDGDPKSTSGFLVPYYFAFQKSGVNDTKAIFKSVEVGSHQQNLAKVAKGEADVATANDVEMGFFKRDFPELGNKTRVVWESPLIPQSPLLWKTSLSADVRQRIRKFVVNFGATSEEERKILDQVNGLSRFRTSSNLQLVTIADIEMFKARQAVNNDTSLTPEQRTKKIGEIIGRGSKLEMRLKLGVY
jgi:phosphonate transport system substrate-binding protein